MAFSDAPICRTCGVQQAAEAEVCPICADDRQYVGWKGQQWTTVAGLTADGHRGVVREEVPGLYGIGAEPQTAIGQRALLVPGEGGNVMWDCVSAIDDETVARVRDLGGISAIALSHPHFFGSMVEWSDAFGGVPIYVHEADRSWVGRAGNVEFWGGDTQEILPGRTLVNCGVHFAGGTVLHWADGRALCTGDIVMVVMDRRWVSFMYSYPNFIPLGASAVRRVVKRLEPFAFEKLYGAFPGRVVSRDAKAAVERSAERHLRMIAR